MKFQQAFTVRVYECDREGKLNLPGLLNYMQEIAARHTVELNITIPELMKRGLTWMLSRYHIVMDRYPVYLDKTIMKTWVSSNSGMFSLREYQLLDEQGSSLARVTSSWVLYDIHKKRIVPVDGIIDGGVIVPERAVDDQFPSLPLPTKVKHEMNFQIRKHDLDINRHVNNRIIAEWALETVPSAIADSHLLRGLEITFKGQAFYGDTIKAVCEIHATMEQLVCLHHITNNQDGASIAVVRTKWLTK